MLIEYIQSFERPMSELVAYLKKNKYDIVTFFTKFELAYQYMIIYQFLLTEHNIVMMITPRVMGIRHYVNIDNNDSPVIYAEKVTNITTNLNHYYMKLIITAFGYIDKHPF